jgi:PAS domain S-box-containing protein
MSHTPHDRTDGESVDRHYRLIVENSSDAAFHMTDAALQWTSPRVTEILGWSPEELVERGLDDLWHPDDRAHARHAHDQAMAGRGSMDFTRMRRKDGDYVWVAAAMRPYVDAASGERGLVGSLRDATDRVAPEKEVADAARAYRLLSENAHDIVFAVDDAAIVQSVSPAIYAGLGWRPADLIGTFLPALVHPEDREQVAQHCREASAGRTPGRVEFRAQARGGAWRWFSATAARMDDGATESR